MPVSQKPRTKKVSPEKQSKNPSAISYTNILKNMMNIPMPIKLLKRAGIPTPKFDEQQKLLYNTMQEVKEKYVNAAESIAATSDTLIEDVCVV